MGTMQKIQWQLGKVGLRYVAIFGKFFDPEITNLLLRTR
jgi:hypothetical protein